ncbi:hypothetical protein ABAC460_07325 [Asticcacaulis sp. AC460]|uniref:glucokinase n=1 Tax=Asticcacaulis sp. AC460 TaxID=1282360 RepID=UPI0003C3AE7A|nr:glucokinase [Asticcacaulis sp. AC460]ESQ91096.1 hypothetical protein ABAC460_07325 [Asticcacaulis sp. AC460]
MSDKVLLCDLSLAPEIGLALVEPGRRPETPMRVQCPTRAVFDDAVRNFLGTRDTSGLVGAALSARGWEQNNELHLVGLDYRLDRDDIRVLAEVQRVNFVNNFVARALAVPGLRRDEKLQICGGDPIGDGAIVVLGPHHGLGLAGLVCDGFGGWMALHGEGGHSGLPVKTEREWRLVQAICEKNGHMSRESGISVAGLKDIWYALHAVAGEDAPALTPAQIIAAAKAGDPRAAEAIGTMTDWLADMAGDMALIMGALGGVYLTGALLDMIGEQFDAERFTQRYYDKGPRSDYVRQVPVFRTRACELELAGLATLYD